MKGFSDELHAVCPFDPSTLPHQIQSESKGSQRGSTHTVKTADLLAHVSQSLGKWQRTFTIAFKAATYRPVSLFHRPRAPSGVVFCWGIWAGCRGAAPAEERRSPP